MRKNGTISIAIMSSSEANEYGEIAGESIVWSTPIECFISTNRDSRIGKYEDGEFRMSAYDVMIEYNDDFISAITTEQGNLLMTENGCSVVIGSCKLEAERVRLVRLDEFLGEFRVQSKEEFPKTGRIKLFVV